MDAEKADTPQTDLVEPTFVLRGSDPVAYLVILLWGCVHERLGSVSPDQAPTAYLTAGAMEEWAQAHGQDVGGALQAWASVLNDAAGQIQAAVREQQAHGNAVH